MKKYLGIIILFIIVLLGLLFTSVFKQGELGNHNSELQQHMQGEDTF